MEGEKVLPPEPQGHVTDPRFGLDVGNDPQLINLVATGVKYSIGDTRLLMREFYEQHQGIRDYAGKDGNHPFSLVLMSEKEDLISDGYFFRAAKNHADYKIYQMFGLSLDQYLEYPPHRAEVLHSLAMEMMKTNNGEIDDASKQLANAQRQLQKEAGKL